MGVLLSIESTRHDTIAACDVAVARVLLGYFEALPIADIPDIHVPPGIVELTRTHSGFTRTDMPIDVGRICMLGSLDVQSSGMSPCVSPQRGFSNGFPTV